ncbi:MAG: type II secretion system major pseudopilin GspG [Deltaproteobacteria bacterium]|nr:type II secretion system major pseudopilin GspG [Deltaproteobacteria bacterium]
MKKRKEDGFSLIELLIVMVILGLLAALVAPKMFGKTEKAKQNAAQTQISYFESALDTYRLDVGRFPSNEEGLLALRVNPDENKKWEGPYLPKEIPLDPWGNPYMYNYPGEHGYYDIISYGADGAPGGEGENTDIVNWKNIGHESQE